MKKRAILVAALLAMMLATAAPALAQEDEGQSGSGGATGYPAGGTPPPPPQDYAFNEDGMVVVDGDQVLDCRTFVGAFDEGFDDYGDQAQAERVLERCKGVSVSSEPPQDSGAETLPETGGVPALPFATGVLPAGAVLFVLRRSFGSRGR